MEYRQLGKTDIKVSKICLGTMTWGEQNTEEEAHLQMSYAIENDINFFDVAEMYPVPPRPETQGKTEGYIGTWFSKYGQRDKVILATKAVSTGFDYIREGSDLRSDQIIEAVEGSLKRLQTDYIDLYQLHWPSRRSNYFGQLGYSQSGENSHVPIEETLRACDSLIQQGKIRHVGVSNETPWGLAEYLKQSHDHGLARIASIQNPYNLLNRSFEVGLAEFSHRESVGLLAYSPLAMGALSGKYLGGKKPVGARMSLFTRFQRYTAPLADSVIGKYVEIANEHGLDPAQMALAYVNDRPFVTSNIIGATNLEQLKSDIDSAEITLTKDVIKAINQVHEVHSNPCP